MAAQEQFKTESDIAIDVCSAIKKGFNIEGVQSVTVSDMQLRMIKEGRAAELADLMNSYATLTARVDSYMSGNKDVVEVEANDDTRIGSNMATVKQYTWEVLSILFQRVGGICRSLRLISCGIYIILEIWLTI